MIEIKKFCEQYIKDQFYNLKNKSNKEDNTLEKTANIEIESKTYELKFVCFWESNNWAEYILYKGDHYIVSGFFDLE